MKNKKNILSTHTSIKNLVAMLRIRKVGECKELCRKRIAIEKALGTREIDYEKCVRICKAFASK
ncbi:MAG: hypothetical protein LM583_07790 [Desulfurococcaceae archaeon]|nr:hypothetical protein [Desulfurococcaceae archaeon]